MTLTVHPSPIAGPSQPRAFVVIYAEGRVQVVAADHAAAALASADASQGAPVGVLPADMVCLPNRSGPAIQFVPMFNHPGDSFAA